MKILGWLLFGTSCALFTACFCKQQLEVQAQDQYANSVQPSEYWTRLQMSESQDDINTGPTTMPAPQSAVASTDSGDVTK